MRSITAIAAMCVLTCACADTAAPAVRAERCRVDLHGKGDRGVAPRMDGQIAVLTPTGNGEGWGGREWRYGDAEQLDEVVELVRGEIDAAGCERVAIHGFSNGASAAAAILCRGETFDGRLAGVLVDDPVTDAATVGCARSALVPAELLWTGALDEVAPPGTACADIDWTCSGDVVRGVDAYAEDLGVDVIPSPMATHARNVDAEQPERWLAG